MKKIGISLRVENIKNYNEKRDTLSHDWIHFLQSIDLLPILIPNNLEHLENYIMKFELDGLILSGGDNIGDFPERDKTETTLLKYAMRNSIPILGVCRGMQIINHFFNGKITKNNFSNHVGTSHYVQLSNEKIINTLGSSKIKVNSFHNNLIKISDLSNELKPFA